MVVGLLTFPTLERVPDTRDGYMGCFVATGTTVLGYAVYNGNLKVFNATIPRSSCSLILTQ
jgi:hypothetical protein